MTGGGVSSPGVGNGVIGGGVSGVGSGVGPGVGRGVGAGVGPGVGGGVGAGVGGGVGSGVGGGVGSGVGSGDGRGGVKVGDNVLFVPASTAATRRAMEKMEHLIFNRFASGDWYVLDDESIPTFRLLGPKYYVGSFLLNGRSLRRFCGSRAVGWRARVHTIPTNRPSLILSRCERLYCSNRQQTE